MGSGRGKAKRVVAVVRPEDRVDLTALRAMNDGEYPGFSMLSREERLQRLLAKMRETILPGMRVEIKPRDIPQSGMRGVVESIGDDATINVIWEGFMPNVRTAQSVELRHPIHVFAPVPDQMWVDAERVSF